MSRFLLPPPLTNPHLLTHSCVAWMKQGTEYEADKNTRLASLGVMTADLQNHVGTHDITLDWSLPLSVKCSEVVGNYSIANFKAKKNRYNQRHYPVIIEFKLKIQEQSVKSMAAIQASAWVDSDDEQDIAAPPPPARQVFNDPTAKGA